MLNYDYDYNVYIRRENVHNERTTMEEVIPWIYIGLIASMYTIIYLKKLEEWRTKRSGLANIFCVFFKNSALSISYSTCLLYLRCDLFFP